MSAASCLLSEDQFLCSICLEVFTDPVTLPCGHNFCNKCITDHWDINVPYRCPNCIEVFCIRPELRVNTFISEMAAQFRQSVQQEASCRSSEHQAAKPGDVPCDICTGTKLKALKSCLVCLASYCETHLEPHLTVSGLKRHQRIDPVEDLEGRVCTKHDKVLELFCKSDQMCVCMLCTYSDHKTHDVVPLTEECEGKKAELKETEAEIQQMIQKRRLKLQEIKRSVELSKLNADREIVEGVQVFTALKASVERSQAEFIKTIKEKQRATEIQAEGFIKELEEEISELMKRSTEVEQLSLSEDHLHLIQSFSSLNTAPTTKDWTEISIRSPLYEGTVRRALIQLEETLSRKMKNQFEAEMKRAQRYVVDVTLDPDKIHPKSTQLNNCRCVLSKQGFTSGRFYFEVQVSRWSTWTLGVTTVSYVSRQITLSANNGYWTVGLKQRGGYCASFDPSVCLSLKLRPKRVGVFVDYEEGLIFFYDVDTAALIYSFNGCSFTHKVYPFFSPCWNDGVKIHLVSASPFLFGPLTPSPLLSLTVPPVAKKNIFSFGSSPSDLPLPAKLPREDTHKSSYKAHTQMQGKKRGLLATVQTDKTDLSRVGAPVSVRASISDCPSIDSQNHIFT